MNYPPFRCDYCGALPLQPCVVRDSEWNRGAPTTLHTQRALRWERELTVDDLSIPDGAIVFDFLAERARRRAS